MKKYKEKEIKAIDGKIKTLESNSKYFIKNIYKIFFFGILFTILGPFYSGKNNYVHNRKSAIEMNEYSYIELNIIFASIYIIGCLILHFVWEYQDKKKLKLLKDRKMKLEHEISNH